MKKMKKLLASLVVLFTSLISFSQTFTTTQPDTVCFGSTTPSTYQVASIGSTGTYTWTVPACASIVSGQGTNQIQVNWSACPAGLITNAISVTYNSTAGCPSLPVTMNVLIYQVTPTIAALGPFCESDPCVTLVGTPAGGVWSGTGVVGNQFCPDNVANGSNATSTVTYTLNSGGCTFTTSVVVPVFGTPTLSPIQHD
jgi:hypothetical protein